MSRFGQTLAGDQVERITLSGGGMTVSLLTRGVVLQGLWLADVPHSLTLGSDLLTDYEGPMAYFGALVGPVANRITGASATVNGLLCRFEANESGQTTLHSGASGLHSRIWRLEELGEAAATFSLDLADGDGGFPGNRHLTARYSLPGNNTLRLDITAVTDAPTLMNVANHSYWNLDGSATWTGHQLRINAAHWLPVDDLLLPTGEIEPASAEMDFRHPRTMRPGTPPLDHNFCLARVKRPLTEAALLTGFSGLSMRMATTEPGLQVYDGRAAIRPAGGQAYEGIALEAQGWPDAPNQPGFPAVTLDPDSPYRQTTEWRFDAP